MISSDKKRKIKAVIIIVLLFVVLGCWVIGYIDVNRRFPKPKEEIYAVNEWISDSNVMVKVNSVELVSKDEAYSQYGINDYEDERQDIQYFITKLEINNTSGEEYDVEKKLNSHIAIKAYPLGYVNQGEIITESGISNVKIKADEEKEVVICFILGDGVLRTDRRWMLNKSDMYLDFHEYPVHKAVLLEDIKGL